MLLSIIGELRVGTSPRPVMGTRLIVPEEQLRAAGWSMEFLIGRSLTNNVTNLLLDPYVHRAAQQRDLDWWSAAWLRTR